MESSEWIGKKKSTQRETYHRCAFALLRLGKIGLPSRKSFVSKKGKSLSSDLLRVRCPASVHLEAVEEYIFSVLPSERLADGDLDSDRVSWIDAVDCALAVWAGDREQQDASLDDYSLDVIPDPLHIMGQHFRGLDRVSHAVHKLSCADPLMSFTFRECRLIQSYMVDCPESRKFSANLFTYLRAIDWNDPLQREDAYSMLDVWSCSREVTDVLCMLACGFGGAIPRF